MELKILIFKNQFSVDERPIIQASVTPQSEIHPSEYGCGYSDPRKVETQELFTLYGELAKRIEVMAIQFFAEKAKEKSST